MLLPAEVNFPTLLSQMLPKWASTAAHEEFENWTDGHRSSLQASTSAAASMCRVNFSWKQEFTSVTQDEDEEKKTILQLKFSFESTHLKSLWVLLSHACNWGPFDDGERPPK